MIKKKGLIEMSDKMKIAIIKKPLIVIGIYVLLLTNIGEVRGQEDANSRGAPQEEEEVLIAVEVLKLTKEQQVQRKELEGSTYPAVYTTIRSSKEGYVEKILIKEGEKIKAGQTLINIDLAIHESHKQLSYSNMQQALLNVYQAESNAKVSAITFESDKAQRKIAKIKLDSEKKLYDQGLSSEVKLNQASSAYYAADAMYQSSRMNFNGMSIAEIKALNIQEEAKEQLAKDDDITKLSFLTYYGKGSIGLQQSINNFETAKANYLISLNDYNRALGKSPFSGKVLRILVEPGQFISGGAGLFSVGDSTNMKVNVYVNAFEISHLKINDQVEITIERIKGEVFKGRINSLALDADAENRGYRVEIIIDNRLGKIKSGESALINIPFNVGNRILLPISVVLQSPSETYVFLAKGDRAVKRGIVLGSFYANLVEIVSGLKYNDEVIVKSQQFLNDNDLIIIK